MSNKKYEWSPCDCPQWGRAFANASGPKYAQTSGTLLADYVSFATGADYTCFPPGVAFAQVPGMPANSYRILPRLNANTEIAAGDTTFDIAFAGALIPNDELSLLYPYGYLTIDAPVGADEEDAVWEEGDNVTVNVDGYDVSLNLTEYLLSYMGETATEKLYYTNKAIALQVANLINQQSKKVVAQALAVDGSDTAWIVGITSVDDTALPYAASTDSAMGAVVAAGATQDPAGAVVGTVMSVSPSAMGDGLGSVTLAAGAAVAVPAGAPIGDIKYAPSSGGGLWDGDCALKVEKGCNRPVASYCQSDYLMNRLPYWDGDLAMCFPELKVID